MLPVSRYRWCFVVIVACSNARSKDVTNDTVTETGSFSSLQRHFNVSCEEGLTDQTNNTSGIICSGNATDVGNDTDARALRGTPMLSQMNASFIQTLRDQANNVSNTSLSDLNNDNDTQQMQMRFRERKRQVRLLTIQRDILQKLGIIHQPNVSMIRLSEEERRRLLNTFDRTMNAIQTLTLPPCGESDDDPC